MSSTSFTLATGCQRLRSSGLVAPLTDGSTARSLSQFPGRTSLVFRTYQEYGMWSEGHDCARGWGCGCCDETNRCCAVQYVVALSRTVAPAELHSAGAHIDEWFGDIVVVRISDAGLAVLRQCPWVRYVSPLRSQRASRRTAAGWPRSPIASRPALGSAHMESGTYGYDGAGNVKSIGSGNTYVYDSLSRLVSAKRGAGLRKRMLTTASGIRHL